MNECPTCGAPFEEWSTRHDSEKSKERKFPIHPKDGCRAYVNAKLKNRCNLFQQDFRIPRMCEEGCGRRVYCFETKIGTTSNRIYFDTPGPPWINHNCQAKEIPAVLAAGYRACLICAPVLNLSQHFLGFQIQIETGGHRQTAFIVVKLKDRRCFVADLHQPFFYKEIRPDTCLLNTYQERQDVASGRFSHASKEYICRKIDHESVRGWKAVFGDENQGSFDLQSTNDPG